MNKYLFLISLLAHFFATAQKTHTITDPEIEFTLTAPNEWEVHDDGFYYLLVIPGESEFEVLSFTYFETHEKTADDQFEGLINADLPLNEPNFKLIQQGENSIDGHPAKWVIYDSTIEDTEIKTLAYMFINSGQIFKIRGVAKRENFSNYKNQFERTIHSLRVERI